MRLRLPFFNLTFVYSRSPFTRDKSSEESSEFLGNGMTMICGENFYDTLGGIRTIEYILHLSHAALSAAFNIKYGPFTLNDPT